MTVSHLVVIFTIVGYTSAFLAGASVASSPRSPYYSSKATQNVHREYVTEPSSYGTFGSPNYPGHYAVNTVYVYQVGHTPYVPVRLIFNSFALENCHACECDNVTIREYGSSVSSVFCGSQLPNGNGVLDLTGPVTITFSSDSSNNAQGFQVTYQIGGQSSPGTYPWHSTPYYTAATSPLPASRCPVATCMTCGPGYVHRVVTRYPNVCPVCECVYEGTKPPPTVACAPLTCPTCRWNEVPRIVYGVPCAFCICDENTSAITRVPSSTWPPSGSTGPQSSTWPASGTTWPRASTWPPISTRGPRASTWPPSSPSPTPRGLLNSLFRIHGELSDLEDKARQIDNEIIDLIQQIEGNNLGHRRSALLDAIVGNKDNA